MTLHYFIKSLIISPAIIMPATGGTNDILPGRALRELSSTVSPGFIGCSGDQTTFR